MLEHAIDVRRHLQAWRGLPGEAHGVVLHVLIVEAEATIRIEAVRDNVRVADVAVRTEEPQLVLHDRTAERRVEVVDVLNAVAGRQSLGFELVGEVVALKTVAGVTKEARSAQAVPAFLGNQVDEQASARDLGARRRRLHGDFLRHRVVVVRLRLAVRVGRVHRHAVDRHGVVGRGRPVHIEPLLRGNARATNILRDDLHAHRERAFRGIGPRRRQRIEHLTPQVHGFLRALHVDDRRRARHGDGLLQRANTHLDVHGRVEVGRKLDAVTLQLRKSLQGEHHLVRPRPEIDDRVAALFVSDHAASPFDEDVARRFNRHSG